MGIIWSASKREGKNGIWNTKFLIQKLQKMKILFEIDKDTMSSSISHTIKKRDTPKDVFYTPSSLVKEHLELVVEYAKEGDKWFEPFYGGGVYYDAFPTENKVFTEIAMGKDFFEFKDEVEMIVSNPPYSMIDKVLAHSVSLKPRIISYLIGQGNMTARRVEYMNQQGYGLAKIHMTKVFKWYGMSYIVVFLKGHKGNAMSFDRKVHK